MCPLIGHESTTSVVKDNGLSLGGPRRLELSLMEQTLIELILGPLGGGVALGFGIGAASGYAFAMRLWQTYKLPALEQKIDELLENLEEIKEDLNKERTRIAHIEHLLEGDDEDE